MAINRENVEHTLRTIFRRCVQCPNQAPSCPVCEGNMVCAQIPYSCGSCASTHCIAQTSEYTGDVVNKAKSPNVGAIAGGVVGSVVVLVIFFFIIWKFCLKGRRQQHQEGEWQEVDVPQEKTDNNDFASRRSARASTHTVASMASSVLTRASNIIQIAYIPGVTNRSGPGSPDLLVPPVPPIPAMSPSTALSSPYSMEDQHFFLPGELRDSTYSGLTDGRSSYARTSITPSLARSSVATTIYRNNAIVSPLPAQTIVRGKAAVVSVKPNGSNSPSDTSSMETPPVPQIEQKHLAPPIRFQMPGMGSTSNNPSPLSRSGSITVGKPTALNITKKGVKPALVSNPSSSTTSSSNSPPPSTAVSVAESSSTVSHSRARQPGSHIDYDSDSDADDHSRARRSLLTESSNPRDSEITVIQDSPGTVSSPFADIPDTPQRQFSRASVLHPSGLETIAETASSKRDSRASRRTQSPFSDDNEIGRR